MRVRERTMLPERLRYLSLSLSMLQLRFNSSYAFTIVVPQRLALAILGNTPRKNPCTPSRRYSDLAALRQVTPSFPST